MTTEPQPSRFGKRNRTSATHAFYPPRSAYSVDADTRCAFVVTRWGLVTRRCNKIKSDRIHAVEPPSPWREATEVPADHNCPETVWSDFGYPVGTCPANFLTPVGWQICQQPIWSGVHRRPLPSPPVGTVALCMVCAYEKPWGIFDSSTGAVVCVECRDAARAPRVP